MSHFSRVRTKLVNLDTLRNALEELGHQVLAESSMVRGWSTRTTKAELVVESGRDNYDIGAVRNKDGTLDLVADWSMIHVDQRAFVGKVSQRYSWIALKENARRKGYTVAREQVREDGVVQLVLRKFV
ncbi:MAG: DUF1257 domain-containing protein [Proteobacteria bacterium]|jgi:hypothetical protein|nr:DUF1257 domain-containing protein [Pseudomonadota bacterium]